jgi:hypothetical protein
MIVGLTSTRPYTNAGIITYAIFIKTSKENNRSNGEKFAGHPDTKPAKNCWDRCYDFLNIFAEKFSEKIGIFDSKQS